MNWIIPFPYSSVFDITFLICKYESCSHTWMVLLCWDVLGYLPSRLPKIIHIFQNIFQHHREEQKNIFILFFLEGPP